MSPIVALRRLGLRTAYRVLQLNWAIRRPRVSGVKCRITDGDRILLVRHTYGPRAWDLPGGRRHRGEPPAVTAAREMSEELGVEGLTWQPLGELRGRMHGRRDLIHVLGADVAGQEVHVDPGEIAAVAWFTPDRLPLWRSRLLDPLVAAGLLTPEALAQP